MQNFLEKWKTLPLHKQIISTFAILLLLYSFYNSIVKVFVTPIIYHLEQDSRHAS